MERGTGLWVVWRLHGRWALCPSPQGPWLCGASRDRPEALGFQPWQRSLRPGLRWSWMGSTSEEPPGGETRVLLGCQRLRKIPRTFVEVKSRAVGGRPHWDWISCHLSGMVAPSRLKVDLEMWHFLYLIIRMSVIYFQILHYLSVLYVPISLEPAWGAVSSIKQELTSKEWVASNLIIKLIVQKWLR